MSTPREQLIEAIREWATERRDANKNWSTEAAGKDRSVYVGQAIAFEEVLDFLDSIEVGDEKGRFEEEGLAFVNGEWHQFPVEHFVTFSGEDWFISHPLSCRMHAMNECEVHDWIASFDAPPAPDGSYEVKRGDDGYSLVPWKNPEDIER